MDRDIPPGRGHNPSAWAWRWPVLALGLIGCGIATYLALYQVRVLADVWEPFFGNGSTRILRESAVARLLPVPDAALGAFAYLLEVVAGFIGGRDRWRSKPWAVLLTGLAATGLGVTGVLLALSQPLLFGAYCTLCLASAACSVLSFAAAFDEVRACLHHLARRRASGASWRDAVLGRGEPAR
jgi:uncharacterized membrane protein